MKKPDNIFLVPVKKFEGAKSRLSKLLTEQERIKLAKYLTLNTLGKLPGDTVALVNSYDQLNWINSHGYTALYIDASSLNMTLQKTFSAIQDWGYKQLSIVPIDLLAPEKVTLLQSSNKITIVPDNRLNGTNFLSIPSGLNWRFRFGQNSFRKHLQQATLGNYVTRVVFIKGVSTDIDREEDLKFLSHLFTNLALQDKLDF